ncbi:MAG: hypothetical protein V7726_03830 [Pseudoalteromonas distincta]|uniref:hypothetical protein n=1 Tax=Pseudoalteromonas distincta TaxID=77608 RepID=UPI0030030DCE
MSNIENKYFIMTEKHKLMSDETSKVRAHLLYLSTICVVFILLKDKSLTSFLGMRFKSDNGVPVLHAIYFMIPVLIYTITHFIYKVWEDEKAFSPEGFDKDLIVEQVISTPKLRDYSPVSVEDYKVELNNYKMKVKSLIKEIDLSNVTSELPEDKCLYYKYHNIKRVLDQYDMELGDSQTAAEERINIEGFLSIITKSHNWGDKVKKFEVQIDKVIESFKRDLGAVHNINHNKELITFEFKEEVKRVEDSIKTLTNETSKRAVNFKLAKLFNCFIPFCYSIIVLICSLCIFFKS